MCEGRGLTANPASWKGCELNLKLPTRFVAGVNNGTRAAASPQMGTVKTRV